MKSSVVVLAAGVGQRLRRLRSHVPRSVVPGWGKPALGMAVGGERVGIPRQRVHVIAGHRADRVAEVELKGVHVVSDPHSERVSDVGTRGVALRYAPPPIPVVNSDTVGDLLRIEIESYEDLADANQLLTQDEAGRLW